MATAKTVKSKSSKSRKQGQVPLVVAAPPPGPFVIPMDDLCPLKAKGRVVDDWDAMLNQTNIGANNNKYYVIQLVESGSKFYTWTRWGRVGEPGQNALLGNGTLEDPKKCFEPKFRDKTANAWKDGGKSV